MGMCSPLIMTLFSSRTGSFFRHCMCSMQVLVELAMEREEDIPALIYEARPMVRPWCSRPHRSAMACTQHASTDGILNSLLTSLHLNQMASERRASARCNLYALLKDLQIKAHGGVSSIGSLCCFSIGACEYCSGRHTVDVPPGLDLAWVKLCHQPIASKYPILLPGAATQAAAQCAGSRRLWRSSACRGRIFRCCHLRSCHHPGAPILVPQSACDGALQCRVCT